MSTAPWGLKGAAVLGTSAFTASSVRDRTHSISGRVGADILLPTNVDGPSDDKQMGKAQELGMSMNGDDIELSDETFRETSADVRGIIRMQQRDREAQRQFEALERTMKKSKGPFLARDSMFSSQSGNSEEPGRLEAPSPVDSAIQRLGQQAARKNSDD